MSIIVQVGHDTSSSKLLMQHLYERGFNSPSPSRSNKLTSSEVSETIDKILSSSSHISTRKKLIENIMIDFLWGNLEIENWGWESSKNISALDQWLKLEEPISFILVFDHPKTIFKSGSINSLTVDSLNQRIEDWVTFNRSLLSFYENNRERCILLEGEGALSSITILEERIKGTFVDLTLKNKEQILNVSTSNKAINSTYSSFLNVIVEEALTNYPEVIALFNKLLSQASIKTSDSIFKTKRIGVDKVVAVLNEIELEQEKQLLVETYKESMNQLKKNIDSSRYEYAQLEKNFNRHKIEARLKQESLEKKLKEKQNKIEKNSNNTALQNNQIIVEQLLKTQEELEKLYQEGFNKESQKQLDPKNSKLPKKKYGAAEVIKSELPYRLGNIVVSTKKPNQFIKLPVALIKEYNSFERKSNNEYASSKLEEYADAHEAEKVKKHLSYQLGKIIIDSKHSPKKVISLPLNIGKLIISFKKNK